MRILSQTGIVDLPYESIGISRNNTEIVATPIADSNPQERYWTLAEYPTESKARKSMEMLREQYARLCSLSTYLHGGMELFAKSISQKEAESFSVEYLNMNIFQFPADDEVEV